MAIPTRLVYKGLKANLPSTRDENSFYLCTDTRELYFGTELYTEAVRLYTGTRPTTAAQGVLYVNDTTGLGESWDGNKWNVVIKGYADTIGADADDSTVPTSKAVKDYVDSQTAISDEDDNILERKNGEHAGLYVPPPANADTYEIAKAEESGDYAAVYQLMRKPGGTGQAVKAGVDISIPKDMVVKSGEVVEVSGTQANTDGYPKAAGTYIKLVLQNVTDPLWIDVGSLIEYVTGDTASDGIITVTVDPATHVATATINDGTITLAKLHTDVQTAIGKTHEHANKAELDKFATGDKDKLDTVYSALEIGSFTN